MAMDTSLVRLHRELNAEKLEFRLLEFSPQAKHSDLIHFDLIYAILLDPPEYETLSYTWGAPYEGLPPEWDDPEPSIPISLNGTVHHIHHNHSHTMNQMHKILDNSSHLASKYNYHHL